MQNRLGLRPWNVTVVLSVFFFSLTGFSQNRPTKKNCDPDQLKGVEALDGEVFKVVDGDTIHLRTPKDNLLYQIRFLSIDTPETHYLGKSQGKWAELATETLKKFLPLGTPVSVELGRNPCDGFGRVLGYVYRGHGLVNRVMLEEGLAVNYCIYPNTRHCEDFAEITRRNIQKKVGMFADSSLMTPYLWRIKIRNGKNTKYVGDFFTKEVFRPESLEKVPTAKRIFFFKQEDVEAPYEIVE